MAKLTNPSGTGTNLKVGGHLPGAKVRGTDSARSASKKIFILVVPLHFLALKVQLVVLVSTFVMVSTV